MDLTKITMPFGLLDTDAQEALKKWPHGIECFTADGRWCLIGEINWLPQYAYRAKAAPSQCWISKTDPTQIIYHRPFYDPSNWKHYREVMDGAE